MKNNILKTYVKRDLKVNKIKSFTILLTIILSFVFISIMSLYSISAKLMFQEKLENGHQASLIKVNPKQVEGIKTEKSIKKAGIGYIFPEVSIGDINLRVAYMDSDLRDLGNVNNIEGSYPQKDDEIIVSESYLKRINKKVDIKESINLNLGNGSKKYIISGILYNEGVEGTYPVFVSKSYVDKFGQVDNYLVQLSMKSPNSYSEDMLKNEINSIAYKYKVDESNVHFFDMYFSYMKLVNTDQYIMLLILAVLLGVVSYLIIHNILYVFTLEDRKNIAILRLIGASRKQSMIILNKRILYIGLIGICLGILGTFSIFFINNRNGLIFLLEHNPLYIIVTLILSSLYIFMVLKSSAISIRKDINRISAKELFTSGQSTSHLVKRKKNSFVTPKFIAWLNIKRDPRKTITMILSLSIGGVLLVSSYAFLKSFDPEQLARKSYTNYEISIMSNEDSILGSSNDEINGDMEKRNPLDNNLIRSLEEVDNVERIEVVKGTNATFVSPNGNSEDLSIVGYTHQQESFLNKKLIEGNTSYSKLTKEKGVIVNQPKEIKKYYGWDVQIGDEVKFQRNGKDFTAKVMGITDTLSSGIYFYIPDNSLNYFGDTNTNFNYELRLELKDKTLKAQKSTVNKVKQLINMHPLKMETYLNAVDEYKVSLKTSKKFLLSITILILIMGVGNLINTYFTNVISRKKEISFLNLVGMSKSQRISMLMSENCYYMKRILIITLIGGVIISYGLHVYTNNDPILGGLQYRFPIAEYILYSIIVYFIGRIVLRIVDTILITKRK